MAHFPGCMPPSAPRLCALLSSHSISVAGKAAEIVNKWAGSGSGERRPRRYDQETFRPLAAYASLLNASFIGLDGRDGVWHAIRAALFKRADPVNALSATS